MTAGHDEDGMRLPCALSSQVTDAGLPVADASADFSSPSNTDRSTDGIARGRSLGALAKRRRDESAGDAPADRPETRPREAEPMQEDGASMCSGSGVLPAYSTSTRSPNSSSSQPPVWQLRPAAPSEASRASIVGGVASLADGTISMASNGHSIALVSSTMRGLQVSVMDGPLGTASGPFEPQHTPQGDEDTCMAHAVSRVVVDQMRSRYGLQCDHNVVTELLIQKTRCFDGGMTIEEAIDAIGSLDSGIAVSDHSSRYELRVDASTEHWDFDALVRAVNNSHGHHHIVTGTHDHAVVAHAVEADGKAVLCLDSNNGGIEPTFRLSKHARGGSRPAKKFYAFHIIECTIVDCLSLEANGRRMQAPQVTHEWARLFLPKLVPRLLPPEEEPGWAVE
jgi:hypothetical protein